MGEEIRVKKDVLDELLAEARRAPDQECCGLLAGRDGVISAIFPGVNVLASATAYEIAPEQLFRFFREMRAAGLEHLGIYHSHPAGPNTPSARDLERAFYSDAVYFIVSPQPQAAQPLRAFRIREGQAIELGIAPV